MICLHLLSELFVIGLYIQSVLWTVNGCKGFALLGINKVVRILTNQSSMSLVAKNEILNFLMFNFLNHIELIYIQIWSRYMSKTLFSVLNLWNTQYSFSL